MNKENTAKKPPRQAFICTDSGSELLNHCQTLENTTQVLELLEYIDFSEGLTKSAEFGLFLVLESLIASVEYVGDRIKLDSSLRGSDSDGE